MNSTSNLRKSPHISSGTTERQWDIYFQLFLDYQKEYTAKNRKFALLYQIGDFYEIYGVENNLEKIGNIREICNVMNIKVGQKGGSSFNPSGDLERNDHDHPLFGGYQINSRVIYEPILTEAGYDVIVWSQTGVTLKDGTKERKLEKIITPATNIDNLDINNLAFVSVYIENLIPRNQKIYRWEQCMFSIGMVSLDISTNDTLIYEVHSTTDDKMYAINELYRFLQSENPKELMITVGAGIDLDSELDGITFEDFLRKSVCTHLYQNVHKTRKINDKYQRITFQEEFLVRVYKEKAKMANVFDWLGLQVKRHARISLIELLSFVNDHDSRLLKKLNGPQVWTSQKYMILSNNAIEQMHIYLPKSNDPGMFNIINKTTTKMGHRLLTSHITSPILDVEELRKRWYFVEKFSSEDDNTTSSIVSLPKLSGRSDPKRLKRLKRYEIITQYLRGVFDISRNYRLLQTNRLQPHGLLNIHSSHKQIQKLLLYLQNSDWVDDKRLYTDSTQNIIKDLKEIIDVCEKTFDFENMSNSGGDMRISYFKKGLYPSIDKLQLNIDKSKHSLTDFKKFLIEDIFGLNKVLKVFNVKKGTDIIHNKNRPISFKVTKTRFRLIDHYLSRISRLRDKGEPIRVFKYKDYSAYLKSLKVLDDESDNDESDDDDDGGKFEDNDCLTKDQVAFLESICHISRPSKGSATKDVSFQSDIISSVSKERSEFEIEMEQLNGKYYTENLNMIDKEFEQLIEKLPTIVGFIDVMNSHAECAIKYAYNKPNIEDEKASASYIKATAMRHPIVERINTRVPFIPNDFEVGTPENRGIIVMGTNDCGKSTIMRSVGLNLVLAQIGSFVAAKTFEFRPFHKILTRLSGLDNVYKGEGSFRVEMNEFRDITSGCDEYSLVLGDELCRGTNIHDAVSIFTAGVEYLSKKDTNFIFTTHLHQLPKLAEIQSIETLKFKHLQIHRDPVTNIITYLRKLVDGPGESFYGIDVARGCGVPEEILLNAERIRKQLIGEQADILDGKASHFNARLYKRECATCGKAAKETHHLREQNEANEDGMIDHFHKNALHNLVWICEDCHHKEAHGSGNLKFDGYFTTTDGYKLKFTHKKL